MEENVIRKEVRAVISELMQQLHPAYYAHGGMNEFPKQSEDDFKRLPEDINTQEDYLVNWEEVSDNNDLYGFPMEEFVKGLHVEKAKRSSFNVLALAEIVINNLKENHRFYSNLGV
jgi:hypothetical protein